MSGRRRRLCYRTDCGTQAQISRSAAAVIMAVMTISADPILQLSLRSGSATRRKRVRLMPLLELRRCEKCPLVDAFAKKAVVKSEAMVKLAAYLSVEISAHARKNSRLIGTVSYRRRINGLDRGCERSWRDKAFTSAAVRADGGTAPSKDRRLTKVSARIAERCPSFCF